MYSEQQAKNGFKTFVVTLSVSLVLFGALYYLVTDYPEEIDIETASVTKEDEVAYNGDKTAEFAVKGISDKATSENSDEDTVFGKINQQAVNAQPSVVMAGAEESTESTVPDTGSEQVLGIAMSMVFFSGALYILLTGPRKFALSGFEKDMTKNSGINDQ